MISSSSIFSRIMSNTALLISSRIINAICSFVYVAWAAQALGLANFGYLLLVTTFVSLICDITHLQSWQCLLHYGTSFFEKKEFSKFHDILAFCIRSDFISGLIGAVVSFSLIYFFGGSLLHWPSDIQFKAILCSLTILCMNTGWSTGVLRLCNKFKYVTCYELITTTVRTIATYIGFVKHCTLDYFLFVWCLTQLTMFFSCTLFGVYLTKKSTGSLPEVRSIFSLKTPQEGMWKYNINTSVNQILEAIFLQGATLAIGSSLGPKDAAVYRVARQIGNGLVKPAQLMIPSLYPEFIKMRDKEDWSGIKFIINKTFIVVLAVSALVLFIVYFFGQDIISYMLHQKTTYGFSVLFILCCNSIINIMMVPLEPYIIMIGKVGNLLKIRIFVIFIYFSLIELFMSKWGIIGSSIEILLSSLILFSFCFHTFFVGIKDKLYK